MPDTAPSHHLLSTFPVIVPIPVQWGEMDAYGHVNNTVFFRYFETARIAYLDRCGFLTSHTEDQVGAILHSTQCRFRRPLHYPDTVLVGARAEALDTDRFTMGYRVVSSAHDEIVAEGWGVIVSFDYTARRKVELSGAVREGIDLLEGRGAGQARH